MIPALSPIYEEVWTIDANSQEAFNDFLRKEGVTLEYLNQVLEGHQAATIRFGEVAKQHAPFLKPAVQEELPRLLWENELLEVYLPGAPRLDHHLWVSFKRPISSFSEIPEEEYIELRRVVKKIQTILRETFGLVGFIFQTNQPQNRLLPGRFVLEMIPPRQDSKTIFNLQDKVECMNDTFWRDLFPLSLPTPTKEDKEKMALFWKSALEEPLPSFSESRENEPLCHQPTPRIREAEEIKVMRDSIFQVLEQRFAILREKTDTILSPPESFVPAKDTCTFCTKRILEGESVYESEFSYILYNYKPASSAHFLILPKRHVRASEDLNEDELRDLYRLTCLLVELLQEERHSSDVVVYTQDSPAVAQKVPHSHTHVILKPPLFPYLIFTMNYDKEPTLTKEQMTPILAEFRAKIQEKLREKNIETAAC